jgi:hypothetical protein
MSGGTCTHDISTISFGEGRWEKKCLLVGSLNLNQKSQPSEVNRVRDLELLSWFEGPPGLYTESTRLGRPLTIQGLRATAGSGYGKAQSGRHFSRPSDETTTSSRIRRHNPTTYYYTHVQSSKLLVLDYVLASRTPLQQSGHLSHSLAIALVEAHIYGSWFWFVRPPAPWFVERWLGTDQVWL